MLQTQSRNPGSRSLPSSSHGKTPYCLNSISDKELAPSQASCSIGEHIWIGERNSVLMQTCCLSLWKSLFHITAFRFAKIGVISSFSTPSILTYFHLCQPHHPCLGLLQVILDVLLWLETDPCGVQRTCFPQCPQGWTSSNETEDCIFLVMHVHCWHKFSLQSTETQSSPDELMIFQLA